MNSRDGSSPGGDVFRFTNPARTITVTSAPDGRALGIAVTHDALRGSESELAQGIEAAARFSRDRARAATADRLVAHAVATADDNEAECRSYVHKELRLPTDDDVDAAIAEYYDAPDDDAQRSSAS